MAIGTIITLLIIFYLFLRDQDAQREAFIKALENERLYQGSEQIDRAAEREMEANHGIFLEEERRKKEIEGLYIVLDRKVHDNEPLTKIENHVLRMRDAGLMTDLSVEQIENLQTSSKDPMSNPTIRFDKLNLKTKEIIEKINAKRAERSRRFMH